MNSFGLSICLVVWLSGCFWLNRAVLDDRFAFRQPVACFVRRTDRSNAASACAQQSDTRCQMHLVTDLQVWTKYRIDFKEREDAESARKWPLARNPHFTNYKASCTRDNMFVLVVITAPACTGRLWQPVLHCLCKRKAILGFWKATKNWYYS